MNVEQATTVPGKAFPIQAIWLWLVLAGILVVTHWPQLFLVALYEDGDYAANALQILDAKSFHE